MVPATNLPTVETQPTRKSTENSKLAAALSTKLETGNFRAAIRICSSDTPAQANQDTLNALHAKHPAAAQDRRTISYPGDNPCFDALQVSREDVLMALCTFPLGLSGKPDGITPQHIIDLVPGATCRRQPPARPGSSWDASVLFSERAIILPPNITEFTSLSKAPARVKLTKFTKCSLYYSTTCY